MPFTLANGEAYLRPVRILGEELKEILVAELVLLGFVEVDEERPDDIVDSYGVDRLKLDPALDVGEDPLLGFEVAPEENGVHHLDTH